MKIHSVIPRKNLKRSRDFVDGDELVRDIVDSDDLVNILTLNSNPACWLVKIVCSYYLNILGAAPVGLKGDYNPCGCSMWSDLTVFCDNSKS